MEEIYKNKKGYLLISSLFVLTTMMMMATFYLSETIKEIRVSKIVDTSAQSYYLAEAGIQEAFWLLQNDPSYKNNFETSPNWSASFSRSNNLIAGGAYAVAIINEDIAKATIISTSTISVQGTQTQRVVKAGVFKATSETPEQSISVFSNGVIFAISSAMQISGGNYFTNDDIDLNLFSSFSTNLDMNAVNKVKKDFTCSISARAIHDKTRPPVPQQTETPQIDFDSEDTSSLKSLADHIYSKQEFKNLMDDNPNLSLNGIIYVTGDITIKKGSSVTINGALVSDGSVGIGNGFSLNQLPATLTVNKAQGKPSGVFVKKNINIGGYSVSMDVDGLIYVGGSFRAQDGILQSVNIDVNGGIIAQDYDLLMMWNPITITHNQQYINEALGVPVFSQVLFINHWEEEY